LSFATLITLVLVPVVASWFDDMGKKSRMRKQKRKEKKAEKKAKKIAPALES